MEWLSRLMRFRPQNQPSVFQAWIDHDQAQAGTLYWDHITDENRKYKDRLIELLSHYPIDYPGKEFIMRPEPAVNLTNELEVLEIAVIFVSIWCYVPANIPREDCCPDGMGGPSRQTPAGMEWFSEYVHLGYSVPNFEHMPRLRNLASQCNPLIGHYLQYQLPQEPGYNDHFRVSLDLYVPLMWDLFPVVSKN